MTAGLPVVNHGEEIRLTAETQTSREEVGRPAGVRRGCSIRSGVQWRLAARASRDFNAMAGRSGGISESPGEACEEAPGTNRSVVASLRWPEGRCRLHAAGLAGLLMKAGLFRYDVAEDPGAREGWAHEC
jgi:hypothetical protein